MTHDHEMLEEKWQRKWLDNKLDQADRDNDKAKFMMIFAYPGVTGYLHVGHLRGYTYTDVIGRYKRMTGYNVLFPVGTHATGNGAISMANRVSKGDPEFIAYLLKNGCPENKIEILKDPVQAVEFFNDVYINDYWKKFGFLADWRRFTCTLYPDYEKFIQWQFRKLNDEGLLFQKPYFAPACPKCGPVAVDASETDISKGGNAETQEYTLLKFKHDDLYLVAATLRPETVYGQVCFWVNPDVEYVKIKINNEVWIVSPKAVEKLQLQVDDVETIGTVSGEEMIGWICEAPMIHKTIPVFPAKFCDPDVGTGLVTSVPSDAPDDWMSLEAVKNDSTLISKYGLSQDLIDSVIPIPIITIEGYGDFPAKDVITRMGIKEPDDPKLVDAKKQVYKDGYHMGRMKDTCGPFSGMRVEEAKEKMKQAMLDTGEAELFHDLTEEVICRCGENVLIKRIDDQWFINYGNDPLTEGTISQCKTMDINPSEYYENIHGVLRWFRERACVRQGNWLGTKFPFDDKWIIEAISDSTLYPLYYIISLYANEKQISPENMNEDFFDYVILGKGSLSDISKSSGVSEELLDKIRKDVEYWYPLDMNLGGKEHMTVHFPVFLMNHRAILPDNMQPRGIMVHWYITGKNDKISKSKGGAQPIPGAIKEFGVDAMRLYYAHVASMFVDVEWNEDMVLVYRQRLDRIIGTIEDLAQSGSESETGNIDQWLISMFNTRIKELRTAMDKYDIRQAATITYFEMLNDFKWYIRRKGNNKKTINEALKVWVMSMMPITPHIAEELWENLGFEGLVSASLYPESVSDMKSLSVEYGENFLKDVLADIAQIKKVAGSDTNRIVIYTVPEWKKNVMEMGVEMLENGTLDISNLTKKCMSDENMRKNGKAVSDFVKKVVIDISRASAEYKRCVVNLDECAFLRSAKDFLSSELGTEVEIFSADEENLYDPQNKARVAVPGRPAILLE